MTKIYKRASIKILILLAIIGSYFFIPAIHNGVNTVIDLFKDTDINKIRVYILSFGIWAPIISFLLMVFQSLIAPLPSFFITLANATIFGWVKGGLLSWISSMTGALLCFYISRYFGRDVVEKLTTRFALEEIDNFFDRYGKYAVFTARLLPFISFDIVSYAAGMTSMSIWSFLLSTGLGQLPATIIYSYAGEAFSSNIKYLVFGLSSIFALTLLIFIVKLSKKKMKNKGLLNVRIHQSLSTSKLLTNTISDDTEVVFFPGCSLCETSPEQVNNFYEYLIEHVNEDIKILLNCCGKPTASIGNIDTLYKNMAKLQSSLKNCKEIITACPNCYVQLNKYLPMDISITSIWEKFAKYGVPKSSIYKDASRPITIHDPCPIRDETAIHNAVREICTTLGLAVVENPYSRSSTICCGAKDMMKLIDPSMSNHIKQKRFDTIHTDLATTYCMECTCMLQSKSLKTIYLGELIFGDSNALENETPALSTKTRWSNRYRLKKRYQ